MEELAFVSHSVLFLKAGGGCRPGHHLIRLEVDMGPALLSESQYEDDLGNGKQKEGAIDFAQESDKDRLPTSAGPSRLFFSLGELPISEKFKVSQVKELIFNKWDDLISTNAQTISPPILKYPIKPACWRHLRIRDGKSIGSSASTSSPLLRDDRTLARSLLALADGRRLIVQVHY